MRVTEKDMQRRRRINAANGQILDAMRFVTETVGDLTVEEWLTVFHDRMASLLKVLRDSDVFFCEDDNP